LTCRRARSKEKSVPLSFHKPTADVHVPGGGTIADALSRTTHLAIGAHPDDVEVMAVQGVLECYERTDRGFGCVTCTDGAGSARVGPYAGAPDEEVVRLRRAEQRASAELGRYRFAVQVGYTSKEAKGTLRKLLVADLVAVLKACRPRVVYTHNLADKHDTHVAVGLAALMALRSLPPADRPPEVYGCETWRDLDWMADGDKTIFDVSAHADLQADLLAAHRSQIVGGKRYDLATLGRRRANATFLETHRADRMDMAACAMDLAPLVRDENMDIIAFVVRHIRKFETAVSRQLAARLASGVGRD
jgi:LmbE family N-acetylglucosaminyl deacetylase